jgi:glycosyltransferase involved in cell wall biosynthesis
MTLDPEAPPETPALPAGAPDQVREVVAATARARLVPVRSAGPADREPVLLVSVVRDERGTLPQFLDHYRRLGVGRFVVVDNGSTDGSAAFLAAQPDVDLYADAGSFRWPWKQAWINRIIARYGYDRWYLYVDADEYLVFDGDARGLLALVGFAEAKGLRRVRGMLVDMYGPAPLVGPGEPGPLAERFPYFDGDSYAERLVLGRISRTGGPRTRVFSTAAEALLPELSKYPLFHIRKGEVFHGPHCLYPYRDNYASPCLVGLLHYKFTEGFVAKARRAVRERSYWQDSLEYRRYLLALEADRGLRLVYPGTRTYGGAADLVRAGLIEPIAWPRAGAVRRLLDRVRRPAWGGLKSVHEKGTFNCGG